MPPFAWPLVLAFFVSLPILNAAGNGPVAGLSSSKFWGLYFVFTLAAMLFVGLAGVLWEYNKKDNTPKPPSTLYSVAAPLLLLAVTPTVAAWLVVGLAWLLLVAVVACQMQEQKNRRTPPPPPLPLQLGYLSYYGEPEEALADYYRIKAVGRS